MSQWLDRLETINLHWCCTVFRLGRTVDGDLLWERGTLRQIYRYLHESQHIPSRSYRAAEQSPVKEVPLSRSLIFQLDQFLWGRINCTCATYCRHAEKLATARQQLMKPALPRVLDRSAQWSRLNELFGYLDGEESRPTILRITSSSFFRPVRYLTHSPVTRYLLPVGHQ